ncbi:hypothetical protein [Paraburkholderia youngii]|uniref:hypothetical protein n=1 Tax=Paraburkholderia youngii TaxID=2782701 RepID=UPI0015915EF6|nr:hypothetical protein [Paraburkholderia youngii]NUX58696.1 hypothetical protein [Paraburkholderia youngii]
MATPTETKTYEDGLRDGEWAQRQRDEQLLFQLQISLECTEAWLMGGCDPKEAAGELRINIHRLREMRNGGRHG